MAWNRIPYSDDKTASLQTSCFIVVIISALRSTFQVIIFNFNKAALVDCKRLQSLRSHTQLE